MKKLKRNSKQTVQKFNVMRGHASMTLTFIQIPKKKTCKRVEGEPEIPWVPGLHSNHKPSNQILHKTHTHTNR